MQCEIVVLSGVVVSAYIYELDDTVLRRLDFTSACFHLNSWMKPSVRKK